MDWKKLWKKLLFLPSWLVLLLTAVSGALLALVFLKGWDTSLVAYGTYALSFYTLCVLTLWCIRDLPGIVRRLKESFQGSKFGIRYGADKTFKTHMLLRGSLVMDLVYVLINIGSWALLRSWWFVLLAVYYGILASVRMLLVWFIRGNRLGTDRLREWKRARICAYVLLLVNLFLSGAVLMIVYQGKGYERQGLMIYVIALHTFWSVIQAVIGVVKYRRMESPVLSAAKIVSLCSALVSVLNLETSMFAEFGAGMALETQHLMIELTGAGVSIAVVTLSVASIVLATKAIRREKYGKE